MYTLAKFRLSPIMLDGSDDYPIWAQKIESNIAALQARAGDVEVFKWAGTDATALGGTVVCVSETGSVAAPGEPAVTEAVDHASGGSQWLRRPVGVLLTPQPSDGDDVRVRLLGRAQVDLTAQAQPLTAGDRVYLKSGTLGNVGTYGQLTTNPAETNSSIIVGKLLVGSFILVKPVISIF